MSELFDDNMKCWLEAVSAWNDGVPARALALSDQLVAAGWDTTELHALRAECLLALDQPQEAFDEAKRVVDDSPNDLGAQWLYAVAAWRNRRLMWAQEAFEKAIELSQHDPRLWLEYAHFMVVERGPKLALAAAEKAVKLNPDSPMAWVVMGKARHRMHDRNGAREAYAEALRLDPNFVPAQLEMAALLESSGEIDKALALTELAEGHREAEPVIEAIRKSAKRKQIGRLLVERGLIKTEPDRGAMRVRRQVFWGVVSCAVLAALVLAVWGEAPGAAAIIAVIVLVGILRFLS
ncbi:hypothetical protein JCM19992_30290 [Thermostilla marina]